MTKAMFKKQKRAPSYTELKIYPNRSHWTCIQPGWEEVADFALDWAVNTRALPIFCRGRLHSRARLLLQCMRPELAHVRATVGSCLVQPLPTITSPGPIISFGVRLLR